MRYADVRTYIRTTYRKPPVGRLFLGPRKKCIEIFIDMKNMDMTCRSNFMVEQKKFNNYSSKITLWFFLRNLVYKPTRKARNITKFNYCLWTITLDWPDQKSPIIAWWLKSLWSSTGYIMVTFGFLKHHKENTFQTNVCGCSKPYQEQRNLSAFSWT